MVLFRMDAKGDCVGVLASTMVGLTDVVGIL